MLLARFRRYAAGAAEPETGSENFCGADALSGFAYRARPPTVNPLDGSENFLIAAYTPIHMHWTIRTGIVFLATAHEPHISGHWKLHQPSELGPLSLLKKKITQNIHPFGHSSTLKTCHGPYRPIGQT